MHRTAHAGRRVSPIDRLPVCPAAGAAAEMLRQCARFIELVDDVSYARASRAMESATIGRHVRHSVDHFAALLPGMSASREGGVIDYDRRDRDVPMETDRRAALEAIETLEPRLAGIAPSDSEARVVVRVMLSADGRTADLPSTLGRELAFAAHHAVHHHAMMRVIAEEFGLVPPDSFGKAPSTVHHGHTAAVAH